MLLEVQALDTAYGASQVLFGFSMQINEGEAVSLLGRNGMGKTTTVRSIMGLTRAKGGTVSFRGRRIEREAPDRIARMGIAVVPEGRQIFPNLTVLENLVAFADNRSQRAEPWTPGGVFELFPNLKARADNMGNQLSGGEQRQLEIAMTLATDPQVLLLDEPLAGMGTAEAERMVELLLRLKKEHAMMLVEHDMDAVFALADQLTVMVNGQVIASGTPAQVRADAGVQAAYLGEEHV